MFVTLEGIDGSGKSLLGDRLEERLHSLGRKVLRTREPGGWDGGLPLREILLRGGFCHAWTEALLFLADRCEHANRRILPALAEGMLVLCERYQDSTLAYQVHGRGLPEEPFASVFRAASLPLPDLTILLDLPSATAWERVRSRGEPDRIEREGPEFRERVRRGYLALAGRFPDRFRVLDATARPEELLARAEALISRRLP